MKLRIALGFVCALTLLAQDRTRLLAPRYAQDAAPKSAAELKAQLANPDAKWRMMPLWVWHDKEGWPRLRQQLGQFKQQGIGGVFIHPRPGLVTEYLSEEWFSLWRQSLAEGKRLGLQVNIYDENSYPTGFAGGAVPSQDTEVAAQVLSVRVLPDGERINWVDSALTAGYAATLDAQGTPISYRRLAKFEPLKDGERFVTARITKVPPRGATANFPYVDLTNPRVMPMFIDATLEAYKKRFGLEFGKTIRMSFSDEPELQRGAEGGAGVAMSFRNLAEFRARNHYDLADHLPSLFWNVGDWRKARFDYWQLMHSLLEENFLSDMYDWCDRNNIGWTGHWWEHLWPEPYTGPADGSWYAYEHVPGIDILWTPELNRTGAEPQLLFVMRQVASAARQLGRTRVLSEAYGGNGWDETPEYFKKSADWQIVHGINLINPHFSGTTVRGARKRDWPGHITDVAAYWDHFRLNAEHTARLAAAMASGESRHRTVVLTPTTEAFVVAAPRAERRAVREGGPGALQKSFTSLLQDLADNQIDFDTGDEYFLDWFGRLDGKRLVIGKAAYDVLVWPARITNVRKQTADKLTAFLAAGGSVVALGDPAPYVDGRESSLMSDLAAKHATQWKRAATNADAVAALRSLAPARVRFDKPTPKGVAFAERFLSGGERVALIVNSHPAAFAAEASLSGASIDIVNTATGAIEPLPARAENGALRFPVNLPPAGSLLLLIHDQGSPTSARPAPAWSELASSNWTAEREGPNTLVLDYVDLSVNGLDYKGLHTTAASDWNYRGHGFASNPWAGISMFRQNFIEEGRYAPGGGFTAVYRFTVNDPAAIPGMELALERPDWYTVKVNGSPIDFRTAPQWLDRQIRRAPIAAHVKAGENVIEMSAAKFDALMEIEPAYVLGNFRVAPAARGFTISREDTPPSFGAWTTQGMPFHSGWLKYTTKISTGAGMLKIELPDWLGSVADIRLDGKPAGAIAWQPYSLETRVAAGDHTLEVRVAGTPWNLFGPFFYGGERNNLIVWPGVTALNAPAQQPAGAAYRTVGYGLHASPRLYLAAQ
jgi:hypothetical protein